jgi:site-specific DNA recombinase
MRQRPPKRDISNLTDLRAGLYVRVSAKGPDDNASGNAGARKRDSGPQEKSTRDQEAEGRAYADRQSLRIVDVYVDDGISASRFTGKERPDFGRLLGDIKAGRLDLIWFWELSRSQRRLGVFADLRDLCRDMGVLWVIRDRVYDPAAYADMMTLGMLSVVGENESELTSERVTRGKRSSAWSGRPAGMVPYGYRRIWHPETGQWDRDEPNVYDGGRPVEDSPAYIVREIFGRIKAGHSITSIRRDLNDRRIPSPWGKQWGNGRIRYIAMSPTYIGKRVYQGTDPDQPGAFGGRINKVLDVPALWPALVDEETFYAVHRILNDPARTTWKPHRPAGRLLASVARCGVCGAKLTAKLRNAKQGQRDDTYACREKACVGIYISDLDDYVEQVMIRWLSDPDTTADLTRARTDDGAAKLARADAGKARAELEEWRQLAERGEISAVSFARVEQAALARIREAEQRIADVTIPPVLAGNLSVMATAGWEALDTPVKRQIIAEVADIRVLRVGKHGNRLVPAADRVAWRWLIGSGDASVPDDVEEHVRAAAAARLAERRDKVAHLRAEGWTRPMIAQELGVSVATVQKDIAALPDVPPLQDQLRRGGRRRSGPEGSPLRHDLD